MGQRKKRKHEEWSVGDRVAFEFGGRTVKGVIIEDRGKIGFKGAWLLTVRVPRTDAEDLVLELPADLLSVA